MYLDYEKLEPEEPEEPEFALRAEPQ